MSREELAAVRGDAIIFAATVGNENRPQSSTVPITASSSFEATAGKDYDERSALSNQQEQESLEADPPTSGSSVGGGEVEKRHITSISIESARHHHQQHPKEEKKNFSPRLTAFARLFGNKKRGEEAPSRQQQHHRRQQQLPPATTTQEQHK